MKAQLTLGRSWPLASHLPGAPASGLTEKKRLLLVLGVWIRNWGTGPSGGVTSPSIAFGSVQAVSMWEFRSFKRWNSCHGFDDAFPSFLVPNRTHWGLKSSGSHLETMSIHPQMQRFFFTSTMNLSDGSFLWSFLFWGKPGSPFLWVPAGVWYFASVFSPLKTKKQGQLLIWMISAVTASSC